MLKKIYAVLFLLLPLGIAAQYHPDSIRTKHVIVVVIDGPRYSETFGDSACTYIPNMGGELLRESVLYTNFRNNGPTYTNSGHTAITTGRYQRINNGRGSLPRQPSFFQYYLKQKGEDKNKAWLVSSKGKLELLANTRDKKWWNTYMPMSYCGVNGNSAEYQGDFVTLKKIKQVIQDERPNLMLINFLEADATAHQNNWEGYVNGIRHCDEHVKELWDFIQNDPEMKDQTTLLVTNDHGRHLDGRKEGFKEHGDGCEGCRHISLMAFGPDFKKDVRISCEGELIDISKTIGFLLKFEVPTSKGRILYEMFR